MEKQGLPLESLIQATEEPEEFLRNPYYWIPIDVAERYFEKAVRVTGDTLLADQAGRRVHEFESWGALDSVLRMMNKREEYYANLNKFFSYFVSGPDKYLEVERNHEMVRFKFPFVRSDYPHCFDFLRSAFETLPLFGGQTSARADYTESANEMTIAWHLGQASLFDLAEDPGKMLNPRIVQNLVSQLEKSERLLEERSRELILKNQLVEKLKQEKVDLIRQQSFSEKMSGLGQLASGVAHEINNPLTYVVSNVKRFREYFDALKSYIDSLEESTHGATVEKRRALDIEYLLGEIPTMLIETQDGLERVKSIVRDLSSLAHPNLERTEKKVATDINAVLDSTLKMLASKYEGRVNIQKDYYLNQEVPAFPIKLSQVFANVISNAVQSIPNHGTVKVVTSKDSKKASIEIMDTGTGMDEQTKNKIFTPFFTTKEQGKGTGLGLSIAHSIVALHEGTIQLDSSPGRGTSVRIELPLREKQGDLNG